ncbi:MAG: transcriptional repressor [Bacillota bacterium]
MGMTKQRAAILSIVRNFNGHPTVEDIHALAKERFAHIGTGTVYRNLNILSDGGTIRRVQIPNQPVRYDKMLSEHEHIVCVKCGGVADIPSLELDLGKLPADVDVLSHSLFVYCICKDCLKQNRRPD